MGQMVEASRCRCCRYYLEWWNGDSVTCREGKSTRYNLSALDRPVLMLSLRNNPFQRLQHLVMSFPLRIEMSSNFQDGKLKASHETMTGNVWAR